MKEPFSFLLVYKFLPRLRLTFYKSIFSKFDICLKIQLSKNNIHYQKFFIASIANK